MIYIIMILGCLALGVMTRLSFESASTPVAPIIITMLLCATIGWTIAYSLTH